MTRSRVPRELLAAGIAALVLLAFGVEALLDRSERLAFSNTVVDISETATTIAPRASYCAEEYVPSDAARLRLFAGTLGRLGPRVDVEIRNGAGALITRGTLPAGYGDQRPVDIRLATPHGTADPARVCLFNRGEHPVQFADSQGLSGGQAVRQERARMRFDFLVAGHPRNVELTGRVMERASLMKSSWVGELAIWLLIPAVIALGATGVVLVTREARS